MPRKESRSGQKLTSMKVLIQVLGDGPLNINETYERTHRLMGTNFMIPEAIAQLRESHDILVNPIDEKFYLNPDYPEYNAKGYAVNILDRATWIEVANPYTLTLASTITIRLYNTVFGHLTEFDSSGFVIYSPNCVRFAEQIDRILGTVRPHPFILFQKKPLSEDAAVALSSKLRGLARFYEQPDDVKSLIVNASRSLEVVGRPRNSIDELQKSIKIFGF